MRIKSHNRIIRADSKTFTKAIGSHPRISHISADDSRYKRKSGRNLSPGRGRT